MLSSRAYMSRAERVEQGLQMTNRLLTLKELHQWTPAEYSEAMVAADESLPLTLHESGPLRSLGDLGGALRRADWGFLLFQRSFPSLLLKLRTSSKKSGCTGPRTTKSSGPICKRNS